MLSVIRSHHTADELRRDFEGALNDLAFNGKYLPAENPFDWQVVDALDEIAAAYPRPTAEQIAHARRCLERQIRGTGSAPRKGPRRRR